MLERAGQFWTWAVVLECWHLVGKNCLTCDEWISNSNHFCPYSALVESDFVIAVDCDEKALSEAKLNAERLQVEDRILFLRARVATRPPPPKDKKKKKTTRPGKISLPEVPLPDCMAGFPLTMNCVDTVITNPPFGTKHNHGMDLQFLQLGCRLAKRAVYSFHKTSTRAYVLRTIERLTGCPAKVVAEMKFDLGQTYKFHKSKSVDVEVDLIRVDVSVKDDGVRHSATEKDEGTG